MDELVAVQDQNVVVESPTVFEVGVQLTSTITEEIRAIDQIIAVAEAEVYARHGLGDQNLITGPQRAQLSVDTLRQLIKDSDLRDASVVAYVFRVHQDRLWEYLGQGSFDEWLDAALPERSEAKWKTVLRQSVLYVLAPLAEQPVITAQGEVIDANTFLSKRISLLQDINPQLKHLERDDPRWTDLVTRAATQSRSELRQHLKESNTVVQDMIVVKVIFPADEDQTVSVPTYVVRPRSRAEAADLETLLSPRCEFVIEVEARHEPENQAPG
jgi:hypothetical protein